MYKNVGRCINDVSGLQDTWREKELLYKEPAEPSVLRSESGLTTST